MLNSPKGYEKIDENLIKTHLCHFYLVQKQHEFVWMLISPKSYEEIVGII